MAFVVELMLLINIVFIFIPLYGKLFIAHKLPFIVFKVYILVIAILYFVNILVVFLIHAKEF